MQQSGSAPRHFHTCFFFFFSQSLLFVGGAAMHCAYTEACGVSFIFISFYFQQHRLLLLCKIVVTKPPERDRERVIEKPYALCPRLIVANAEIVFAVCCNCAYFSDHFGVCVRAQCIAKPELLYPFDALHSAIRHITMYLRAQV